MSYKTAQQAAKGAAKSPETRSEETGQEAGFQMDDQFESFDIAVADSIVDLRGARIMQLVLTRIAGGDMGKIAPAMFKSFEAGTLSALGEQVKQLTEWHKKPLKALAPADKPKAS
ncbi:hypothetical protein [Nostoc sp. 'Lobaria pulmonaria (5183) cyanobiont']|uniref:hypothetical protein n=1 Tax=Nostoc sp. 'Lobaria pulmonaria (5183) cyanobiont' TaxID=1618022 RepID=UPI000CF339F2|nr:hypothetical protein [Nostoc sp. 'Lobaria pulmonaria (5183) cyanobiont']